MNIKAWSMSFAEGCALVIVTFLVLSEFILG